MGRPKSYNEDVVLERAMFSFWKHGYDQLSIRQLEKDMGINQFSIYSSFESKENLFRLVLEKYKKHIETEFLADMNSTTSGIRDIERFLVNFSNSIQVGQIPNGCLMVNTSSELPDENSIFYSIVKSYFGTIEDTFRKVLHNEKRRGNLSKQLDIDQTALYLLGIAQSISILSKTRTKKEIEDYVSFAMRNLY